MSYQATIKFDHIERQNEYTERLTGNFHNIERQMSILYFKIGKLEAMKND